MSNYTYMVTNKINGKVYVGSHSWDGEGLDKNYYVSGTAITRAVKKYGKENFQVEVLYYYDTIEECRADEERILTEYDVKNCPHSYNCKNSAIGWTSEELTGRTHTEDTKKKMSQAHKGKTLSENTRNKISEAKKGENNPMYGRTGEKSHLYGKPHTEEHRNKIAIANGGKPFVAIKDGKIKIFTSQMECSRVLGLYDSAINSCLKGRRKSHKGYAFKYVEELESGIYEGMPGIAE